MQGLKPRRLSAWAKAPAACGGIKPVLCQSNQTGYHASTRRQGHKRDTSKPPGVACPTTAIAAAGRLCRSMPGPVTASIAATRPRPAMAAPATRRKRSRARALMMTATGTYLTAASNASADPAQPGCRRSASHSAEVNENRMTRWACPRNNPSKAGQKPSDTSDARATALERWAGQRIPTISASSAVEIAQSAALMSSQRIDAVTQGTRVSGITSTASKGGRHIPCWGTACNFRGDMLSAAGYQSSRYWLHG